MGSRRSVRLFVAVALTALAFSATNAWGLVQEPGDAVAASFDLTALQPIVQVACPYPDLFDGLRVELKGTETDQSNPPHPELTGALHATLITYLSYSQLNVVGNFNATLNGPGGQVLYVGSGPFSGLINEQGHVVGRGLLSATLFENGVPTDKRLVANFTFDEDLGFYGVTGDFGISSDQPSFAVETVGTCGS
jgi:hypothetical protein